MKKPYLGVLIHTPRHADYSVSDALGHLQNMIDHIFSANSDGKGVKIQESSWHLDVPSNNQLLRYSGDDITSWRHCAETYGDHLAAIGGTIKCKKGLASALVDIRMCVHLPLPQTHPHFQGERTIFMAIPEIVWRNIDPAAFADQICQIACALKATYACLDTAWLPITSLHTAPFRLLCENGQDIDPEDRLPGIYWGQYITPQMTAATASLDDIAVQAPCEARKIHAEGELRGVWLQLPSTPIQTPIESRHALRRYFERSLYALSPEIVKRYSHMAFRLIDFDMLPLLPEERHMAE